MTEQERRIEALMTMPPKIARTAWQKVGRVTTLVLNFAVVGLIVFAFYARQAQAYENCRNDHASAFQSAEAAKVCGQVKGLAQIVPQTADQVRRIAEVCGGVPAGPVSPVAGIAQFEDASLAYLETIRATGSNC